MLRVNIRRLDRHGTVEEDGKRPHLLASEHPAEQTRQQLRAPDRESGHEDFATLMDRVPHNTDKFLDGFGEGPMVVIAISRLEKDQVRMMERFKITQDRDPFGTEVAREDNSLFATVLLNEQLYARRTKHVTRLGPEGLNTVRDWDRLTVRHRL